MRRFLGISCLVIFSLMPAQQAWAQQERICADLRSQLASLPPEGNGNSLVQQQLNEIQKARGDLQRLNCASAESQANRDKMATCERIADAIESMEQNYIRLSRSAGNSRTAAIRADILAQMNAAKCDRPTFQPQQQAPQQAAPRSNSEGDFLGWLFGRFQNKPNGGFQSNPQQQQGVIDPNADSNFVGGALRTLCVRKCDGYYWPVSFSTSSRAFTRDAEMCQQMCPTQETELFYHHIQGQWSDDMVSVGGTPYRSMSYAFQYRQSYNPSCSCRPQIKPGKDANVFDWKPGKEGNSGTGISQAPLSPLNKDALKEVTKSTEKPTVETQIQKIEDAVGAIQPTPHSVSDGALSPIQQVNRPALSTPKNLDVDVRSGGGSSVDYNALREVPKAGR